MTTGAVLVEGEPRPRYAGQPAAPAALRTADAWSAPLADLFPDLPRTLDLRTALAPITLRGVNGLARAGATHFGDIADWRIPELRRLPNVGDRTVEAIVSGLYLAAGERRTAPVSVEAVAQTWAMSSAVATIAEWTTAFLDPTLSFAEALGVVAGLDGLPSDIERAIRTVHGTSVDAIAPHARPVSAHEALCDWFASLSEREVHVVLRRTLATEPRTLRDLADDLGVSPERVRTVEAAMLERAAALFRPSWLPLGRALEQARTRTAPVAEVDLVGDLGIDLCSATPGNPLGAAETLARLSGQADVSDGLIGWPSVGTWSRRITTAIDAVVRTGTDEPVELELVEHVLADLGIGREAAGHWVERAGYELRGTRVRAPGRTIGELAHRQLAEAGVPLSTDQIRAGLPSRRPSSSVRHALNHDDRIVRVGPQHWSTTEDGAVPFVSLAHAVGVALDRGAGSMRVSDLVEELQGEFVVSAASVRVIVGREPFVTVGGTVTRR